jgi:peptidyl-prolyl cis-trans isomerase D
MMKFLRSQSQTVLVVVLGVIGLGFLFYGTAGTNLLNGAGARTSNDYGRVDGEDLSVADLSDAVRNTRYSIIMEGQSRELEQPGASAQVAEMAWSQLLILREADRLHIVISDTELVDFIRKLPMFQKDGVYSPDLYKKGMTDLKYTLRLPDSDVDPLAGTKDVFEKVLRNNLRLEAVTQALFSSVRSSAHDVSAEYQKLYGPATVSLVTFDPKTFIAAAQVTPAEVEAEYKTHPGNPAYRTAEKRKVDYVLFMLSPDQAKLPDAQKAAAKDALGQKALDFALAFQPEPTADGQSAPPPPDFLTEAKKRGLNAATSDFFAEDTPPANVPPSPAFNSAAFSLTKDNTISKVVELDNGVAVLHLAEIQPSDLRPLDEVKGDIMKELQQAKGMQAAQAAAQITAKTLQAIVAKGADFKTVAEGMKLKVETLSPFVPFTALNAPQGDQRLQAIAYATASLTTGQVSNPVPLQAENSTLVFHLQSRGAPDPAGLAGFETRFRQSEDQQLREQVRSDWVNWKNKQAGTHKPPDLDAYGSVE